MSIQKQERWRGIARVGVKAMMVILVLVVAVLGGLMMIAELTVA